MADEIDLNAGVALDGFADYYTEKLWNWIPGFYRSKDANTLTPGTLRERIEQMGADAAGLRRRIDRLWENNFVELADDGPGDPVGDAFVLGHVGPAHGIVAPGLASTQMHAGQAGQGEHVGDGQAHAPATCWRPARALFSSNSTT